MQAEFVMSAPQPAGLRDLGLPEVAFVGRSNVGKSTLVGRLLKRPKLVRTSRTPGRTQLLNLFTDGRLAYVDLPGYGYAKLSKRDRARMQALVYDYLALRRTLTGVVQILDARRASVTDADRETTAWILRADRPLLVLMSKADLVAKTHRLAQQRRVEKDLGLPPGVVLLCSGKTGEGLDELRSRLDELCARP